MAPRARAANAGGEIVGNDFAPGRPRDNMNRLLRHASWAPPLAIILLWQVVSSRGLLSERILPSPLDVGAAAIQLARSGELFVNLAVSFGRAAAGFLIGGSIGFALGLLNGSSRVADALLDGTIQMVRTIPHLALIPLVILWFGIGEEAKIFLVSVGVLFPIYVNTHHGVRSVDPGLIEMGRVYGLDRRSLFRDVILPGAMPAILVGVRYALGVMWLTLIVAETISAKAGIGYMAMNAREFLRTDVVLVCILLYALLGKLADLVAKGLERRWLAWSPAYQPSRREASTPEAIAMDPL